MLLGNTIIKNNLTNY